MNYALGNVCMRHGSLFSIRVLVQFRIGDWMILEQPDISALWSLWVCVASGKLAWDSQWES